MKTKSLLQLLTCLLLAVTITSCVKDKVEKEVTYYTTEEFETVSKTLNLPDQPIDYVVKLPEHFTNFGARAPFINNSVATLGRVLFYDKKLSANNTVSCASCHLQERAFADPVKFSEGFAGELTKRNSFALGAVANFEATYGGGGGGFEPSIFPINGGGGTLFWDNRSGSIADQTRQTLTDPIEMGADLHALSTEIAGQDYYKVLFSKAFGTTQVNEHLVFDALDQFINSMITSNSKFDEALLNQGDLNLDSPFSGFTAQENNGKALYMANCSSCHGNNMVTTFMPSANNGLDLVYDDKGIGDLSNVSDSQFDGLFKVPLLRNVELTGPYMHDGRFETLREVVEHYNSGIKAHPNLDIRLTENFSGTTPINMNLSETDKDDLIAFLHTLTDNEFITEEKYADPFK